MCQFLLHTPVWPNANRSDTPDTNHLYSSCAANHAFAGCVSRKFDCDQLSQCQVNSKKLVCKPTIDSQYPSWSECASSRPRLCRCCNSGCRRTVAASRSTYVIDCSPEIRLWYDSRTSQSVRSCGIPPHRIHPDSRNNHRTISFSLIATHTYTASHHSSLGSAPSSHKL